MDNEEKEKECIRKKGIENVNKIFEQDFEKWKERDRNCDEKKKVFYNSDKYKEYHPCAVCGSKKIATRCIVILSTQTPLWCCYLCAEDEFPNNYKALYATLQ
jgi:hypothetical protein